MDSLRGADITDSAVAGSIETIGANSADNNVRGGHSVHTASGNAATTISNNSVGGTPCVSGFNEETGWYHACASDSYAYGA